VYGICVRSSAAFFTNSLISAADGDLGAGKLRGGGFRSYERQTQLRATRIVDRGYCPVGTYILLNSSPVVFTVNTRLCPQVFDPAFKLTPANTAAPGTSNHEVGRAIDFTYNGAIIQYNDIGWNWLVDNACYQYGFTPISKEAWHWEYLNDSWFRVAAATWNDFCDQRIGQTAP
jgi:LAS superfamily LD-carboxypeptidase LdcB